MSSQPLLSASFLSQRLVAAVEEVMELVKFTVIQYEQESTQIRRENQLLRNKLGEITGGIPPELDVLNSQEWAGWTTGLDQNPGPASDQQNPGPPADQQNPGDVDLGFRDQDLSCGADERLGLAPRAAALKTEQEQNLPPEPVSPGAEPPSCVAVKAEWASNAPPEPDHQSQHSHASDVIAEVLLSRTVKLEPEETGPSAEPQSIATETMHFEPGTLVTELESVAIETVHFEELPLDQRAADGSVSPPVTSRNASLRPAGGDPDSPTHLQRALAELHPPAAPPARPPAQATRDPAFLQRPHGNPEAPPNLAAARGRPKARCATSFQCQHCGKLFVHRSRLKVHLLIHTGEKPYACQRCGKRFNNDGTLKNHQRVHTQLRLYSCPLCPMRFKDAYTCRKHLSTHTRRAAQAPPQHTHTHTHRPPPQDSTHARRLHTHNNTLNTHALRAQGQTDTHTSHTRPGQHHTDTLITHTHGAVMQSHTHNTQNVALWSECRAGAGGRGQS